MADSSSEHIIRILVTALNKAGDIGDKIAKDVNKATSAQEKHTKAVKSNDKAIEELRKEYAAFVKEVKDGNKSYDEARLGLSRLGSEFDKLSRKEKIGSALSEDLNRSALAARNLGKQLEVVREQERKLNEETIKKGVIEEEKGVKARRKLLEEMHDAIRKDEQQRIAERDAFNQKIGRQENIAQSKRVDTEIAEEKRGVKARQSLMQELLDTVRQDHEDRLAFNRDLSRRELDDERKRTKSRIDEAHRFAQQAADVSRRTDVTATAPTLRQRIAGFFGRDTGPQKFTQQLTGLGRASDDTEHRVSRLDRTLERLHGTTDKAGFSVARIDNNLRGLIVLGVVAFSQQLISTMVALGSTMLAVASTAVQAGAALGGAFVAAAGQAVPAIGLIIAAFGRIGAVFKAVDLFNKQSTRSGRDQAATADAQAAAADRVTSAQEGVVSATQRVQEATEALTDARKKAIENIEDLNLAERRASLSRFESQGAIRQAISSGDVGALEGLRIQSDAASLESRRATGAARTARTEGVRGSDEVRQATQTLEDANTALGRARREMNAANRAATRSQSDVSAADQALAEALAQLTPAERALFESIKRIQARFKTLFRPITDIVVRAFTDAVDRVSKTMGDSRIIETFKLIAEAVSASIGTITRELTSAKWLDFFRTMGREAARNLPLLTKIAISFNRIMRAVALAGGPALRRFIDFLGDVVTKGEKATDSKSGISKLQDFFLKGEEYAESIAKLTFALVELFLALTGAGAADTGQNAIDQLTEQIQKATDWVNDHKDEVKQFFADSLDAASAIAVAAFKIAAAATALFDNEKVQAFAKAFTDVVLPALTTVIQALGSITFLMSKFLDLPVVGGIAQIVLSATLLFKAFSTIGKVLTPFAASISRLLGGLPLVGKAFRGLAIAIRFAAAILSGPWGLAIAGAVTAIVLLDNKFHFIQPTIKFLGNLLKDVLAGAFTFVKSAIITFADTYLGMITTVLGGISTLASVGSKLPGVGGAFKAVADAIDDGRNKIDGWRESLRELNKEHDKSPSKVEKIEVEVSRLSRRLGTLKKGSDEYRETAVRLRQRQEDLNVAMVEADAKGRKGARGPRALGRSATSAAEAVDDANRSIVKGYNKLAEQLGGIKKITYSASGVTVRGKRGSITADTGDITANAEGRAMGGWMGGQAGGPQGPDDILVRAGRGEAFLNVPQQPVVESALALQQMLIGGPGSLTEVFRQYGGAFAEGGRVAGIDLKGARSGMAKYAIDAAKYMLSVSSGLRPGSITSSGNQSLHSTGDALDLVGSARNMLRYARHAVQSYGRQLAELIHTPLGFGIKGGKRVPLSFWGGTVNADHVGHVHVGSRSGGAAGGIELLGDIGGQRIRGPEGALRAIAQRAVDRIRRAANRRIGDVGAVGPEPRGGAAPANAGQIRRWIAEGLRVAGQKVTQGAISTLFGRVMQESGGDPTRVNLWDTNARRGDPSKGLLQTIGATFRRYMVKGHGNVFNPVDNVAAAVRYMLARYGHLVGAGPGGYQTGGFIGRAASATNRRGYSAPTLLNTSFQGLLDELKRANEAIRAIQTRGPKFVSRFTRSIRQITDDGGLLDLAQEAIKRVVDGMALKLRQAAFAVTKSGVVVRRLTPEQQNLASIGSIDRQRESLTALRGVAERGLDDVDRRIALLRRGGVTAKERKAYETLVTARRALIAKIQDIDVAVADAVEARFQAQEQAIQDGISAINEQAQRMLTRADLADRVANVVQTMGTRFDQTAFAIRGSALQARAGALIGQRDRLTQVAGIAGALGRQDIVQQLVAQIEDLNVQLFENAAAVRANTVAARQAQIDAITNRGGFFTSVFSGLAGILQTIGATTGTLDTGSLKSLNMQTGTSLKETGDALRQQLGEAFGLNLLGAYGTRLVSILSNTNLDALRANLDVAQQGQFDALINAIIDNAGAIEQNTQQLQELNASQQVQSFTTTAWQLFRRAIFSGMGAILPQFQVPMMQSGGAIMSSGLLYGHEGERIVPAGVSRNQSWEGDTNNIYITNPTETADPGYIAEVMSFHRSLKRAGR